MGTVLLLLHLGGIAIWLPMLTPRAGLNGCDVILRGQWGMLGLMLTYHRDTETKC